MEKLETTKSIEFLLDQINQNQQAEVLSNPKRKIERI